MEAQDSILGFFLPQRNISQLAAYNTLRCRLCHSHFEKAEGRLGTEMLGLISKHFYFNLTILKFLRIFMHNKKHRDEINSTRYRRSQRNNIREDC